MASFYGTRLTCRACGHSHIAKGGAGAAHLAACLRCGVEEPGFDRESVSR